MKGLGFWTCPRTKVLWNKDAFTTATLNQPIPNSVGFHDQFIGQPWVVCCDAGVISAFFHAQRLTVRHGIVDRVDAQPRRCRKRDESGKVCLSAYARVR